MKQRALRPAYFMGALIALLLAVAAGAGLLYPAMYDPFITSEALRAGLPVQDAVSLLVAPALLAAMFFTARGMRRAYILWAGLVIYAGYYYAFFVFGFTYTLLYPAYLAIVGLSVYALIVLLLGADCQELAAAARPQMPVRFLAAVLAMPLLLAPLWLMGIWQGIQAQRAGGADLVFVLDLALLIPAMTLAAVQLWRRRPVGFLLGGVLLVKAALSGLLLTAGSLRQVALGYAVGPDFGMYIFLLVAGLAGLVLYLRNLEERT